MIMELSPDTLLHNRYKIIRLLGQGGMGAVYLANDTSLDQQVAVKVNYRPGEDSSSQFYREARLLASLRHQHLPRVIDYFVITSNQFLVMDFIPGEDLGSLITREGRQSLDKVTAWAKQLGEALVYLHSQHPPVIHRDIKPANIKITPGGELVLVDFGIAKATEASQATSTGAAGYTPGFAPPEQYGAGRSGPYTDQFSFAATLYMLLTGQRPADSIERTLNQVALTPIRQANPAVPASFEAAIFKAMALRPDERYASVRDLLTALTDEAATPKKADLDYAAKGDQQTIVVPHEEAKPAEAPAKAEAIPAPPIETPAPPAQPASAGATVVIPPQKETKPDLKPVQATYVAPPTPAKTQVVPAKTVLQPMAAATVQVPLSQAEAVAAPASTPKTKAGKPWPLFAGGAVLLLALLAGGFFIMRGIGNKAASPTQAPTLPIVADLLTATATDTPAPTFTSSPSDTPEPTSTPQPSATPTATIQPIGGGGVVAFSSDRGGNTQQIWTMHVYLDNSGQAYADEPQQFTSGEGNKTQPVWSPDGKKLLYVAPGGENFGLDIWIVNTDGSEPVDITRKKGDDTDPAWSPDGKTIAFTNNGRSDGIHQVFTIAPDGTGLKRISFDQEEYMPIFSPDGKSLAEVLYVAGHEVLYIRNRSDDFATLSRFDNVELLGRLGYVRDPAWSPDGAWIAYTRTQGLKTTNQNIFSVRFSSRGGDIAQLTSDNASRWPAWSPDSHWIVFTSTRDGNAEVYIMSNNGQFQVNLTNSPGADMQPDWQPRPAP